MLTLQLTMEVVVNLEVQLSVAAGLTISFLYTAKKRPPAK